MTWDMLRPLNRLADRGWPTMPLDEDREGEVPQSSRAPLQDVRGRVAHSGSRLVQRGMLAVVKLSVAAKVRH